MSQIIKNVGLVLLLGFLLISGCAREAYNISWSGVVADKTTGKPVKHARIVAVSSYQANIDETAKLIRYVVSDEYGRFGTSFERGFGLTVRTSANGYLSGLDYKVIKKSNIKDTIFLSPHPFDASLVVRKMDASSFSSSVPFIRESQIVSNEPDGAEIVVKWGFDFLSGTNTENLDSADVWIEINKKTGRIALNASQNGGLFPVIQEETRDFMTHVTKAPETGYVKSHVIKGNEAGFFVLCRNGINIAKMIPEERICILSYEETDGDRVRETGIRFDYLFQPDIRNRLFFPVSASASGTDLLNGSDVTNFKNEFSELDSN
jgi:hypothetical protein